MRFFSFIIHVMRVEQVCLIFFIFLSKWVPFSFSRFSLALQSQNPERQIATLAQLCFSPLRGVGQKMVSQNLAVDHPSPYAARTWGDRKKNRTTPYSRSCRSCILWCEMRRIALLNVYAKEETLIRLEESNDTWGWQTLTLDTAKAWRAVAGSSHGGCHGFIDCLFALLVQESYEHLIIMCARSCS